MASVGMRQQTRLHAFEVKGFARIERWWPTGHNVGTMLAALVLQWLREVEQA
jgi:hypothetical protein